MYFLAKHMYHHEAVLGTTILFVAQRCQSKSNTYMTIKNTHRCSYRVYWPDRKVSYAMQSCLDTFFIAYFFLIFEGSWYRFNISSFCVCSTKKGFILKLQQWQQKSILYFLVRPYIALNNILIHLLPQNSCPMAISANRGNIEGRGFSLDPFTYFAYFFWNNKKAKLYWEGQWKNTSLLTRVFEKR